MSWMKLNKGDIMKRLLFVLCLMTMIGLICGCEKDIKKYSELNKISNALIKYSKDHNGKYPANLSDLSPKYLNNENLNADDGSKFTYKLNESNNSVIVTNSTKGSKNSLTLNSKQEMDIDVSESSSNSNSVSIKKK